MESGHLRASDHERDAAARRLRDHCAEGRLSVDELDMRVEQVLRAQTIGELERLTRDLPGEPATAPRRIAARRIVWPGVAPFHEERHLDGTINAVWGSALREIVPRMGLHGFQLIDEIPPRRLHFGRDDGLNVTVMFHASLIGGTDVSAFGEAPRAIRKAFAELRD
jgi:hypothetical protein